MNEQDKRQQYIDSVLHYVLETEHDHFEEEPSEYHIYYDAYCAYYGEEQAAQMLREYQDIAHDKTMTAKE